MNNFHNWQIFIRIWLCVKVAIVLCNESVWECFNCAGRVCVWPAFIENVHKSLLSVGWVQWHFHSTLRCWKRAVKVLGAHEAVLWYIARCHQCCGSHFNFITVNSLELQFYIHTAQMEIAQIQFVLTFEGTDIILLFITYHSIRNCENSASLTQILISSVIYRVTYVPLDVLFILLFNYTIHVKIV